MAFLDCAVQGHAIRVPSSTCPCSVRAACSMHAAAWGTHLPPRRDCTGVCMHMQAVVMHGILQRPHHVLNGRHAAACGSHLPHAAMEHECHWHVGRKRLRASCCAHAVRWPSAARVRTHMHVPIQRNLLSANKLCRIPRCTMHCDACTAAHGMLQLACSYAHATGMRERLSPLRADAAGAKKQRSGVFGATAGCKQPYVPRKGARGSHHHQHW